MRWLSSVLCLLLAGCGSPPEATPEWSLVGVYDAAALVGVVPAEEEEEDNVKRYVWVQSPRMKGSCGPAKAPDGLGVFEASAMANGLSPVLAVLLERTDDGSRALTPQGVRVSLGTDEPLYQLQPAVMPRYIAASITGDVDDRYKQLVRTQLEMELCMEHKTGRGWVGGDNKQLRQAFLLDPPEGAGPDRKYFGGQRDPVPPLLGPPDACLMEAVKLEESDSKVGRGEGDLSLQPADVWGASLRWCDTVEEAPAVRYAGSRPVPLALGQITEPPSRSPKLTWTALRADLQGGETADELDITLDLTWGDEVLLDDHYLMSQPMDDQGRPTGPPGLTDVLERVPYEYPMIGTRADPGRYTVLLVPNWQVVEGLRRMNREDVFDRDKSEDDQVDNVIHDAGLPEPVHRSLKEELTDPMGDPGLGIQDGIGFVLENPEYLFIQLPPKEGGQPANEGDDEIWLNVAQPLAGGPMKIKAWGYSPGMLSGRAPVTLPGTEVPTWEQVTQAHYTGLHALFLGAFVLLLALVILGLSRVGDLWANIPEERVDFWPTGSGAPAEEEEGDTPAAPEGLGGGG